MKSSINISRKISLSGGLLLLFHFLFFTLQSNAQLIVTKPQEISVGPCIFNPNVIKASKIKRIDVVKVDKPDGAIIIDKGEAQGYDFDTLGRLKRYYYTVLNNVTYEEVAVPAVKRKGRIIRPATTRTATKYINDTIFANVFYDKQSRIICKRVRTGDYYDAYYYEYNEAGQIKKEMHFKETNVAENKSEFRLGVQSLLSTETFEYVPLTATQVKKRCINDEGREYKKVIINYDAMGNKLSENFEYIVSWMHSEKIYVYDATGKLIERTFSGNESGDVKDYSAYQYSPEGALLEEKRFRNDDLTHEVSYLYDERNMLVRSQVDRDHKNASIGIVKYGYTFY
ncbi:MAG: hypothetical protein ACJ77K_14535 [Bacteroidia bacterium]